MPKRILSNTEVRWAYDQWCNGRTQMEIADALFCHFKTVRREFEARGLYKVKPVLVCPPEILGRRKTK